MALQIEKQNLMARINLPMGRVEIRTDEGGHSLDLDIANLTLKYLLLLRIYADPTFARSFRYDREDITRARANETLAAEHGLRAEIENPLTGKPISMRALLKWTLNEVKPMAASLDMWRDLEPLIEISEGGRNTAEKIRARLQMELGENDEVPPGVLRELSYEREAQVRADVERIAAEHGSLGTDAGKIAEFLQRGRDSARQTQDAPIQFRARTRAMIELAYPDKTSEILDLAQQLVRIPSVTASPNERLDEVHRAGSLIDDYLRSAGLEVKFFDGKYPAVYASFPAANHRTSASGLSSPILLTGHFDVVEPDPDDSQFSPRLDGDYLWGRGAADMKTVVATYLVWIKDRLKTGRPFPNVALLLVGNEENGEAEAWGTPHVLKALELKPALLIAGERTGEKGDELFGEICVENRGVLRFDVIARGARSHSGIAGTGDLSERLIAARTAFSEIFTRHLTLQSADGWQSQAKFPFINVGTPGVYNVTAGEGILGVEIRPIPGDDVAGLRLQVEEYCAANSLELCMNVMESGVACSPDNPALNALIDSVKVASGSEPRIGKKLPGTSARFAPGGQAVVWGQSGIGPHAKDERHYIPSIEPYYRSLNELAKLWG
jgi:succinyl-diaminopimelate desuccinylase